MGIAEAVDNLKTDYSYNYIVIATGNGVLMEKVPQDLLDKCFRPNFNRDGYCYANSPQQSQCLNYKKVEGSRYEICKWQGIGTCCNYTEKGQAHQRVV